jgi:hypothetical protein
MYSIDSLCVCTGVQCTGVLQVHTCCNFYNTTGTCTPVVPCTPVCREATCTRYIILEKGLTASIKSTIFVVFAYGNLYGFLWDERKMSLIWKRSVWMNDIGCGHDIVSNKIMEKVGVTPVKKMEHCRRFFRSHVVILDVCSIVIY